MKKQRLDSIAGVQGVINAIKKIEYPDYVFKPQGVDKYFNNIISSKASSLWTLHEIELAAMLASSMVLFDKERETLAQEGRVVVNASGNPVNNPRVNTSRDLWSEIIQGRRSLGLQDAAKGNLADRKKHNELAISIEESLNVQKEDASSLFN